MSKCLNPVKAWICGTVRAKDGVISPHVVFSPNEAMAYYQKIGCLHLMDENAVAMPCGHCINCQMQKRKDMSVRLAHEASCHNDCCFLTLTYNDESVPTTCWNDLKSTEKMFDRGLGSLPELTLYPRDVQLFMKRFRAHLKYHFGIDHIRFFAVGEYGGRTRRPHYHVMIFGWKPTDLVLHGTHNGKPIYRSALIESKWKYGYSSVSEVTPFVAKYAARYVTKKYARLQGSHDFMGKCLVPEFTLQSVRNGGIGATWFDRYGYDACKVGLCTLRCSDTRISKHAIPRYYWNRLRKKNVALWVNLRDARLEFVKRNHPKVSFNDLCNIAACAAEQIKHEITLETF